MSWRPRIVAASEGTASTLAIVGDTLLMFASTADFIGAALVGGIGLPLFSFAILRTKLASKWVAWLGFLGAVVGGWLTFLGPVSEVFEIISTLGFGFFIWMIVMGVVLWRTPESVNAHL